MHRPVLRGARQAEVTRQLLDVVVGGRDEVDAHQLRQRLAPLGDVLHHCARGGAAAPVSAWRQPATAACGARPAAPPRGLHGSRDTPKSMMSEMRHTLDSTFVVTASSTSTDHVPPDWSRTEPSISSCARQPVSVDHGGRCRRRRVRQRRRRRGWRRRRHRRVRRRRRRWLRGRRRRRRRHCGARPHNPRPLPGAHQQPDARGLAEQGGPRHRGRASRPAAGCSLGRWGRCGGRAGSLVLAGRCAKRHPGLSRWGGDARAGWRSGSAAGKTRAARRVPWRRLTAVSLRFARH